jgi:hypothetical protein
MSRMRQRVTSESSCVRSARLEEAGLGWMHEVMMTLYDVHGRNIMMD